MDKLPITFPPYLDVSFTDDDKRVVTAQLSFDETNGVYLTQSLNIAHPFSPVTATVLRRLKLRTRLAAEIRKQLEEANPDLVAHRPIKTFLRGSAGRPMSESRQQHPTEEQIAEAGAVIELAIASGDFPIRSVQHAFGLDDGVHRRWASLARATGMSAR